MIHRIGVDIHIQSLGDSHPKFYIRPEEMTELTVDNLVPFWSVYTAKMADDVVDQSRSRFLI